jgi:hypothetical protein
MEEAIAVAAPPRSPEELLQTKARHGFPPGHLAQIASFNFVNRWI